MGDVRIVTTDEVLAEFLNGLCKGGELVRKKAVEMVREILKHPNVEVVPQTRASFLKGVELYEQRPDKLYSLTDCISMNVMRPQGLDRVLTNDHHFSQEGFAVLMDKK